MSTIKRTCPACLEPFEALQAEVNRGRGIYCSKPCYWLEKKKQKCVLCLTCGKPFEVIQSREAKYCSIACYGESAKTGHYVACKACNQPTWSRATRETTYCSKVCVIVDRPYLIAARYGESDFEENLHGLESRIHRIWSAMKARCYNPAATGYKHWGGRGIEVCESWRSDYVEFLRWALVSGYKSNLTIDRIDVNGGYTPANCRWATIQEQQKNKRKKHYVP